MTDDNIKVMIRVRDLNEREINESAKKSLKISPNTNN